MTLFSRKRHPRPQGPEATFGGAPQKRGWTWWLRIAAEVAAVLTLVVLIALEVRSCASSAEARLAVERSWVTNLPAVYASTNGRLLQTPATEPTIEAEIHNSGDAVGWVEKAQVTIEDAAMLRECVSQGGSGESPQTKRYRVTLPEYMGIGSSVSHDLRVEVAPGHKVIARLAFQTRDFGVGGLYALRVRLHTSSSPRPLDLGRFVIGVPDPVSRYGLVLPEEKRILQGAAVDGFRFSATWCYRYNLAAVKRITSLPGKRGSRVAALKHLYLAPGWSKWGDHRPPAAAIAPLMHLEAPEAPLLAVFAAERTGDDDLVAKVRQHAAALLLNRARKEAGDYARGALQDIERSLSLEDSEAAKGLLPELKVKVEAEEAKMAKLARTYSEP